MQKIAVTGASGVVGRALCDDLSVDHDVVAIDIVEAPMIADVRNLAALERAFAGCSTVVHLGGHSKVETPWQDVLDVNICGTYNAFEAARRAGCKRVIFASSNHVVGRYEIEGGAALYEPAAGVDVGIDVPIRPDSLYGVGKAFGEALGRFYSETYGLQVTCVRIGSIVAGDRPNDPALGVPSFLPHLSAEAARKRYAATWMSKRDFARLLRAIEAHDVPFAIVYGVGDNATRFWDLEPGRVLFGFWPLDGVPNR